MKLSTFAAQKMLTWEHEVIRALRAEVKEHGAKALLGYQVACEAYPLAGLIKSESWSEGPVLEIESQATGGMIFPQILKVEITGRTLWAEARIGSGKALRVQLTVTMDEGETTSKLVGWLW